MNSKLKTWLIGILATVLLLAILNPSPKQFKEDKGYKSSYSHLTRTTNGIVFSIYDDYGTKYLGIALNFFRIK